MVKLYTYTTCVGRYIVDVDAFSDKSTNIYRFNSIIIKVYFNF